MLAIRLGTILFVCLSLAACSESPTAPSALEGSPVPAASGEQAGATTASASAPLALCAGAPSAPLGLHWEIPADGDVRLYWELPATNSGDDCDVSYQVRAVRTSGLPSTELRTTGDRLLSIQLGAGNWEIVVWAFNALGVSAASDAMVITVPGPTPCAFGQPPGQVSSLVATAANGIITVTWTHPGSCSTTGFLLSGAQTPTGPAAAVVWVPPNYRSYSTEAPPGAWYVRAHAEWTGRLYEPSPVAVVVVQ